MITLEYDAEHGHVFPDGKIDRWIEEQLAEWMSGDEEKYLAIGNEVVFSRFRVMAVRGTINHKSVQIIHEGKIIQLTERGSLAEWPATFCSFYANTIREIAQTRRNNRG